MQSENVSTFQASLETYTQESDGSGYAVVAGKEASWRQLLPSHRLPVIAKTPILVAVGVYMAGGQFNQLRVALTMIVTAALWTVLYAINESTDLAREHQVRVAGKKRLLLFGACTLVCAGAFWLSPLAGGVCLLMAGGQLAYCEPPVRLKRFWWAVLLLSGMLNPFLRLQCGALLGNHAISTLTYLVFVSLHLGASIRSRVLQRQRDRKLGYQVAPPRIEWAGMACTGVGLAGAYALCWQGVLPHIFVLFVTIATVFSVYAWSNHVTSVSRLRQGWLWFAILALVAFALLYFNRS